MTRFGKHGMWIKRCGKTWNIGYKYHFMSQSPHAGEHFVTLIRYLKILGFITDYFENISLVEGGNIKLFV